jgi:hypothetical protein
MCGKYGGEEEEEDEEDQMEEVVLFGHYKQKRCHKYSL